MTQFIAGEAINAEYIAEESKVLFSHPQTCRMDQ